MKTKSALIHSAGALLVLLVFIALPSSPARASQGQCGDVDIYWEYGGMNQIFFELEVEPSDCVLYVTTTIDNPNIVDPSRSGATPISPTFTCSSGSTFYIPYGHTMRIKAFAWKANWTQSVNISSDEQHNPNL
jgi:hypothetical protein